MNFRDKICWITGASSGIGKELSILLAKEGAKLLLSGSNVDLLTSVRDECLMYTNFCTIIPFDLSNPIEVEKVAIDTVATYNNIFLLINNGGISHRSLAAETPLSIDRRIMEVDYFSHVAITKAVVPTMVQNGAGYIAATSSIAGKFGFHRRSAYSAAKHALQGFFETLRVELRPNNISVTIVYPGYINTPISIRAIDANGKPSGKMDNAQLNGIPAKRCAIKYLKAIKSRKPEVIIAGKEKIMVYLKRFFPCIFFRIIHRIRKPE
jgi:short-subunit dehydrogenase